MLFLLLLFWQIIIHQVFTNIYTCLSSLRKSQFSYVHAHMNYGQHFFLCQSSIALPKPRNYERHFYLKLFDYCLSWLFILFFCCNFNFFKILFIYFQAWGKGGRKRGRETSVCGCLSHAPTGEPDPQPRHMSLL